jgi:Ca2+-binding RTX toxin-like protein
MNIRTTAAAAIGGLVLLTAQALALAPGAQAATGTVVERSGFDLYTVFAQDGKTNNIRISTVGTPTGTNIVVEDSGDLVIPGSDCVAVNTHRVECVRTANAQMIISGGDLDDIITNITPIPAVMQGGSGNDTITAGDAPGGTQNILTGDAGTDTLTGGALSDRLSGGAGIDRLLGGAGQDTLDGGPGDDTMTGGLGTDTYVSSDTAADGADVMNGDGSDISIYSSRTTPVTVTLDGIANDGATGEGDNNIGIQQVTGGNGRDVLTGNAETNLLRGGPGNDVLDGGAGTDGLSGDQGDDILEAGPGVTAGPTGTVPDNDLLFGGDGVDTVRYLARTVNLNISLNGQANDGATGEGDNVGADVENVASGSGNDTITGNASANRLAGGPGIDTITGGAGNDVLQGQNGDDTIDGVDQVSGNDSLDGGNNTDTCTSDAGDTEGACEL